MQCFDLTGASSTLQETRTERKLQPRSSKNQQSTEQAALTYFFSSCIQCKYIHRKATLKNDFLSIDINVLYHVLQLFFGMNMQCHIKKAVYRTI